MGVEDSLNRLADGVLSATLFLNGVGLIVGARASISQALLIGAGQVVDVKPQSFQRYPL